VAGSPAALRRTWLHFLIHLIRPPALAAGHRRSIAHATMLEKIGVLAKTSAKRSSAGWRQSAGNRRRQVPVEAGA